MFVPARGALIGGRYMLEQVIGRGGMGEVWRAEDRELDNACAVKLLLPHLATDKETRARFLREARAVAKLGSPHVVQVLGAGEHEGSLYLAMELLLGESLAARLSRSGRLDAKSSFAVVEQVGQALARAHRAGIVHRDLKPDNIWLWEHPEVFVKVLDFGVAKSRLELASVRTSTGALLGTPHYMSPEQANGERELDHRADLWSLGIIAIECLTGKRPYESEGLGNLLVKIVTRPAPELSELGPDLPPAVSDWWKRALAHDPEARFQSAEELVEGLRQHLLGEPARTWPSEPPQLTVPALPQPAKTSSVDPLMTTHSTRPRRRSRWVGLAVMAASLVALTLVVDRRSRSEPPAIPKPPPPSAQASTPPTLAPATPATNPTPAADPTPSPATPTTPATLPATASGMEPQPRPTERARSKKPNPPQQPPRDGSAGMANLPVTPPPEDPLSRRLGF